MKKYLTIIVSIWALPLLVAASNTPPVNPIIPRDEKIEQRIDSLLGEMTLEEKIGQMTELVSDVIGNFDTDGKFQINEALLDTVIGKYKIGSILNAPGTIAQTKEDWFRIINAIQKKSMQEIGIPCVYGLDQNHGTTYTLGGTFFPQPISIAASFNKKLPYEAARITAYETRAGNCPWVYSPCVDLGRDPRWPRITEDYGEDVLVNAIMGSEAVKGFQGTNPNAIDRNHTAVSLKHFMGYGVPFTGKDRTPVYISPSDIREKHFAPFLACLKAGALTVMANSGSVNGLPTHINYDFLTRMLKDELKWDGVLVTDWADINQLWRREKVAADKKEAIKLAINAGIDMAMEPYEWDFCTLLKELVEEGEVPMSRINDAVRRVLRLKFRLGLFEHPDTYYLDYPDFGSEQFANEALRAAEESMVLLKNKNNILPLASGKKILVTGPNANSMRCLNGGWTYTWQGHKTDEIDTWSNTIYKALANKFGYKNVKYVPGVTYKKDGLYWEENVPDIKGAVKAAKDVDYIIACVGENSYCETPGNLTDLSLSKNQLDLVKSLAETGKPIILALNEGRPRIINEIEPLATAVVDILLPGSYGGDALANLLSGDVNFSGRLPYTYPKEINSLFTYDHKVSEEVEKMAGAYDYDAVVSVQWPFGYGKSYTNFAYSNLRVDNKQFTSADTLRFKVDITNTGKREGKESVLLYSSDLLASMTPDGRRLRAFDKISLNPGEKKTVTFTIPASNLAFVGYDGKWVLEEGDFNIQVGDQLLKITCVETKKWETPNI